MKNTTLILVASCLMCVNTVAQEIKATGVKLLNSGTTTVTLTGSNGTLLTNGTASTGITLGTGTGNALPATGGTGSNITLTGNTAITGTLTLPSIIIPLIADDEATLLSATNLVTNAAYYAEDTGKLVVSGSGGVPSVVNSGTASALASGTSDSQITWTQPQLFNNIVITSVQGITAPDALNISSDSDATFYNTVSGAGFIATAANMFFSDNAGNSITFADGNLELGSGVTLQGHTLATGTDAIVTRTGTAAKADSLVTGGTSTGVVLASSTIASPTFSGTSGGTVTRTGTFIGGVHQSGTYTGAMTVSSGTLTIADTATIAGLARLLADRSIVVLRDEFVGGNISSYVELGELGWRMANIHGSNLFALVQGHSGRPGVYQVNATTGSGTNALTVFLNANSNGANAFNNLSAEANWQLDWSLALTSTATEIVRVGFFNTNSSMSLNRAVFIRYDTSAGDTTFKGVTVQSGTVASTVDLGVTPAASTFYNLRLRAGTAGTVYFSVNGGTEYSATVSNAGTLQLGVQLQTLEAVQKSLYLDYFSFFQTGLTR